ncbi:MAG: ABC transporter substrate-binding protein [Oscillospiraceae bacterium]|nr:ABC transporter substrate-binding protein [Oscillospiraceae bacterium]MDY2864524.1 ABC transporter substrate-binding protein [Oscillospiraceae bacterium]
MDKVTEDEAAILVTGEDYPLTVRDYLKYETTIESKPERVAVMSGTPLNIWYDLGGKSVCTSDVSSNIRLTEGYEDEIKALPQIGPVYSIDMESVIAEEPDLIIAQVGTQSTQGSKLREMGYNVIQTNIRGFDDVVATYRAFGKLLGQNELAEQRISELEKGKKEITDKLPDDDISVVILYVTSKSLAVKLDNSIAGDIAKILELDNIASDLPPDTVGSETTPLDIEYIVENDPDYVLVTTMISSNAEARKTVEEQFASNPAWNSVNAVNEGRVIYLPQQYYLYNAGPYYVDAIEYMAQSIYPEIYGEAEVFD